MSRLEFGVTVFATAVLATVQPGMAGLDLSVLTAAPTANVVLKTSGQASGAYSMRFSTDKPMLDPAEGTRTLALPFRRPDRDLGVVFTAPAGGIKLDAIVTKLYDNPESGALGASVSIQLFEVSGTPKVNPGKNGKIETQPLCDDFIEGPGCSTAAFKAWWASFASGKPLPLAGETYKTIAIARGGVVPRTAKGGSYLKWDLTGSDEITLEGGKRYGWLFMFDQGATSRRIFFTWSTSLKDAHGIRREGNCDDPRPNEYAPDMCPWEQRIAQQPGTWGHPDVDTYRTLGFFLIGKSATTGVKDLNSVQNMPKTGMSTCSNARVFDMRGAAVHRLANSLMNKSGSDTQSASSILLMKRPSGNIERFVSQ